MDGHFSPARMRVALVLCLGFALAAVALAAGDPNDGELKAAVRTWAERNYLVIDSFKSVESSADEATARIETFDGGEILIHLAKASGGAAGWVGVGCEAFDSLSGVCGSESELLVQLR